MNIINFKIKTKQKYFSHFYSDVDFPETVVSKACNYFNADRRVISNYVNSKVIMQGKLFQRCTHLSYCSVLSLGGNVNTRRMSKPDMGSIFHIQNLWNILVIGNYYVNYQNYQNLMLLSPSDNKRTLVHLFLFTNSAQRELVSICTQSIRNCN